MMLTDVTLLIFLLISLAAAQTDSSGANERPLTSVEVLKHHHIALTETGLIDALYNPDPQVRWLAAQKLAQDQAKDAIPAIIAALRRDQRSPKSEVNIAYALAQLGSEEGYKVLVRVCQDSKTAPNLRLVSARYLLDLGNSTCLSAVIDILQKQTDDDVRVEGLSLITRFTSLSDADRQKIVRLIVKHLTDGSPTVRVNAAIALADIGDTSALPDLEGAIAREKEDAVRSQMQDDLHALEKKRRSP